MNQKIHNSGNTITGIILARTDSSRLPGKVLIPVAGVPLIGYVIARARKIKGLTSLVLATTIHSIDDQLCDYALKEGINIYRGDLDDVALRVLNCAKEINCDYFVRLNGDSPFLDPQLIDHALLECREGIDLISNIPGRTFPYGISVEVIRTLAFEQAYVQITGSLEREHITTYIYNHPEIFNILTLQSGRFDLRAAHVVVDDEEDLYRFTEVVNKLGNRVLEAGFEEVSKIYLQLQNEQNIRSGN